ncbi:hypothetical protein D9V30_13490 [Mycetocola reblochoni]|uniref:Uncharacterized protein n=1 Tax=Mycetocola reblochoni TaxID=331618 RepID=A0A3L6ZL08_9MICO|nr:hypothetical protein [Mycetocola reblochoni]RLP67642.1 hypothetical protein D9V30_13490 [Mycetocola reblochoni]
MSVVDTIGIIGELLSWVGAFAGVPFLIAALVIHAVEGPRLPTNVTIIEDLDHRKVAQWAVEERTYSRPLTVEDGPADPHSTSVTGYFRVRHPHLLDIYKRSHRERVCLALAATLLSVAVAGFLASLAPMFW